MNILVSIQSFSPPVRNKRLICKVDLRLIFDYFFLGIRLDTHRVVRPCGRAIFDDLGRAVKH